MRRTKKWWVCLTKEERSMIVSLERAERKSSGYSAGGYLPDDCCECGACSTPHLGTGLCLSCLNKLIALIKKADNACLKQTEQEANKE